MLMDERTVNLDSTALCKFFIKCVVLSGYGAIK